MTFETIVAVILGSITASVGLAVQSYKSAPSPIETKVVEKEITEEPKEEDQLILELPRPAVA